MSLISYKPLNLYRQFKEAAQTFPDVAIYFDQPYVSFPELCLENTYQTVFQAIQKRSSQLAALGIRRGDKVILYKSPTVDTYLLAVALTGLGAVPVMISYHLPASNLDVFAQRLEKSYLIYDDETKGRVAEMTETERVRSVSISELLAQPFVPMGESLLEDHVIQYMTHTSGTTGVPKLICHTAQTMGWRVAWQQTIFDKMIERGLLAFHISPVHSRYNIGISSAIGLGFPLYPLSSAKIEEVEKALNRHAPLALETHPNNFVQWSRLAKEKPEVFSSIRYYHSTFDAINIGTLRHFLEASQENQPVFMQVYGQSECGPMIFRYHRLENLGKVSARDMGVGLTDYTQARVTDREGKEVPVGENGHIHLYSRGRAVTYFKEDERFQENVYGDWWDSGDYGCMTTEGTLLLKDRQVDVIDSIDSNLALEDLLLDQLDCLSEVVIIRDVNGAPQPIISIVEGSEMDWDAWWRLVADLPLLKEPIIMDYDAIPRTATMKVQRLKMEEEMRLKNL